MGDYIDAALVQTSTDTASLEQIGEFILHLMQAFLRTGYYLPDHPEAMKAKAGLYDKFAVLTGSSGEVAFLIKDDSGSKSILVEGVADQPLKLLSIMSRGMAETYTPRFVNFLARKHILSLSLPARMEEVEFSRFVDIMSEPGLSDMEDQTAKEQFVEELRKRDIFNLSFVFEDDFITQRHGIPWRTRMALSRLRKDIRMIPVFRNLSEEEFHRAKFQILTDILRPIALPVLIYSFLLHIDLVANESLTEEDGENGVFSVVAEPVLIAVGRQCLNDATGKGAGFPEHVTSEKKSRLLAKMCRRLNQCHDPRALELVEQMFSIGVIAMEELHPRLKERLLALKFMTEYLSNPAGYLMMFEETGSEKQYEQRGRALTMIVPYLIERHNYAEAVDMISALSRHVREDSWRRTSVLRLLATIAAGTSLADAAKEFRVAPKETRSAIGRFFISMGKASISHLLAILSESNDTWRRKQSIEILITLGSDAALALMHELEQERLPVESVPAVLRLLGGATDEKLKPGILDILVRKIRDNSPQIRAEALAALYRLKPAGNFDLFRMSLEDTDLRVKKNAIRGIGRAGNAKGAAILANLIEKYRKRGAGDDGALATAAIDSLGMLMVNCPAARSEINASLERMVSQATPRKVWKKLLFATSALPEEALLSLTELIGKIEGKEHRNLLVRLAGHRNRHVAKRAGELSRRSELV